MSEAELVASIDVKNNCRHLWDSHYFTSARCKICESYRVVLETDLGIIGAISISHENALKLAQQTYKNAKELK